MFIENIFDNMFMALIYRDIIRQIKSHSGKLSEVGLYTNCFTTESRKNQLI